MPHAYSGEIVKPIIVGTGPLDDVVANLLKPFGEIVVPSKAGEEGLLPLIPHAIGLVVRGGGSATAALIREAKNLRVIGRSGSGYDSVDIAAATERKIPVVFAPGLGARAVAEAAVAFMFALCKNIPYWDCQLKSGNWGSRFESRPGDLDGATLGIVGFGNIGQHLAQMVVPFRVRVLVSDPYVESSRAAELGVHLTSLEKLVASSDFISLHAPQTPETIGMINRDLLRRVKPGAFLINMARGALIENLDVLYEALQDGRLAGIGLDVFEPEPPDQSHPIFKLQNCLTSPHVLGTSDGAMREIFRSMAEDMAAVLRGQRPRFVVNPEVFEGDEDGDAVEPATTDRRKP
jgi:D-3-phosphoglycerate dehydrogenase / 2-oxoglutarate reductase